MKKVVIILPTYQEKENVIQLITILDKNIIPKLKEYTIHILVADDTSPDGTADAIKKLMNQWKNVHLSLGEKKGLGAAYFRGMSYAVEQLNADLLLGMDADGQHNPEEIALLLQLHTEVDIVVGSRYVPGGSVPKAWGPKRRFVSRMASFVICAGLRTTKVHDWTNSFRLIRKEVFLKEKNKLKQYTGSIFFLAFLYESLKDGFRVKEVPIKLRTRAQGDSKIIPGAYIKDILKYLYLQNTSLRGVRKRTTKQSPSGF